MQPGVKIAISGKGGVGKTTVCAVWSQLFAEDGLDVLAIDADSDPNLSSALGVALEDAPEPLIAMTELIEELRYICDEYDPQGTKIPEAPVRGREDWIKDQKGKKDPEADMEFVQSPGSANEPRSEEHTSELQSR